MIIGNERLNCQWDEEKALVRAAVEGDRSAFDRLVRQYSARVFKTALAILGNWEDAADVQQDVFIRAYKKLRTFRGQSSFETWIYAITVRLCLMRRRSAVYKREEPDADILARTVASDISPEDIAVALESTERVRHALSRMMTNDRLLIVLKFIWQFDHKEIAKILGCSEESSRSRLVRAKKLFRELYGEME